MKKKRYIYALMDGKGRAFYVGQTNDPEMRLLEHVSGALGKQQRGEWMTPKEQHIAFLVQEEGRWPTLVLLREGEWSVQKALEVEDMIYWRLRNAGHQLLNADSPLNIATRKKKVSY